MIKKIEVDISLDIIPTITIDSETEIVFVGKNEINKKFYLKIINSKFNKIHWDNRVKWLYNTEPAITKGLNIYVFKFTLDIFIMGNKKAVSFGPQQTALVKMRLEFKLEKLTKLRTYERGELLYKYKNLFSDLHQLDFVNNKKILELNIKDSPLSISRLEVIFYLQVTKLIHDFSDEFGITSVFIKKLETELSGGNVDNIYMSELEKIIKFKKILNKLLKVNGYLKETRFKCLK